MIPEGLRYGFSIGTGYPDEKLPGKLGQKSRKMTDFARMWSRKILEQNRLVPRAAFCKTNTEICTDLVRDPVFEGFLRNFRSDFFVIFGGVTHTK